MVVSATDGLREGRRARIAALVERAPPARRDMAIALDVLRLAHLTNRKRQTLASLTGVVLGVAFFLGGLVADARLEKDFLKRLVDNIPHITVYDEFRYATRAAGGAALARRGRRGPQREAAARDARHPGGWPDRFAAIEALRLGCKMPHRVRWMGSAVFIARRAPTGRGRRSGVVPEKMKHVTTIEEKMTSGLRLGAGREPERRDRRPGPGRQVQLRTWAAP